ncbi:MAG: ABC transporter ATP-binding protein [Chloroflexota bacterium]
MPDDVLVQIRDLSVIYQTRLGPVSAVDHISFDIRRGEILGLVGESGCGKSTLGKALMRMIALPSKISSGQIVFDGEDIMQYNEKQMRDFRGRRVSMIFQDPMTSLNPVQRVDQHLIEAIRVHEPRTPTEKALERVRGLIERLGIQRRRLADYPHQLSGGMRQRVMIGLGLVLNASLIVADEATTSLDVIVEAKLIDEFKKIRQEFGVSLLAITHNIALVAELADRIAVMYAGHLVELGPVTEVFDEPLHPYTQGLLQSVPSVKLDEREDLYKMPGEPPNLTHPPSGCRFHPRCPHAMPVCSQQAPDLLEVQPGHWVECWLYPTHPG